MAGIHHLSGIQQFDKNTALFLSGGQLYLYEPGTSTPLVGYKDINLTLPHPNPIPLDSAGRVPVIFIRDGTFRHRLDSSTGINQFDQDGIPVTGASSGGGGGGSPVDATTLWGTRDIKIRFDSLPLTGYVRINGLTIGNASSGSTERANADCQALFQEMWPYCFISGGKGPDPVTDWANNKQLVLPDWAGRIPIGMTNMGAGTKTTVTTDVVPNIDTSPGFPGGNQKHSITVAELPSFTPTVHVTIPDHTHTIADHNHTYTAPGSTDAGNISGGAVTFLHPAGGSSSTGNATLTPSTTSLTPTVTADPIGGGTQMPVMPPVIIVMVYLKL